MEEFVKGDVVIIPFPFSDLSSIKLRLALYLTPSKIVRCKDASNPLSKRRGATKLSNLQAFEGGELNEVVSLLDQ